MNMYRTKEDWSILINEYSICKKKLESKREALKIVMAENKQIQVERDVYKNKSSQLQIEVDALREVLGSYKQPINSMTGVGEDAKKIRTLNNLLQFSRDENELLKKDLQNLKHLYSECQKDNLLLHTTLSRHDTKKILHEKEDKEKLIVQLEEANSKVLKLEQELQICRDEKLQLQAEKDSFNDKNARLNAELNYILHNDDKRIVDIDAFVLENKYLKEVVKQYKEEKMAALTLVSRYKEALNQRKFNSKKQSYLEMIENKNEPLPSSNSTVQQLQRVNKSLTEMIAEKELALKHQRNTNRVLGTRVSELEKKLRTLEVSGLWSHEQRRPRYLSEVEDTSFVSDQQFASVCSRHDNSNMKCGEVLNNKLSDLSIRTDDNGIKDSELEINENNIPYKVCVYHNVNEPIESSQELISAKKEDFIAAATNESIFNRDTNSDVLLNSDTSPLEIKDVI